MGFCCVCSHPGNALYTVLQADENRAMSQNHIPQQHQLVAEGLREAGQRRRFRRNQIFGLLIIAALILLSWLLRTQSGWILPTGWWRL